MTQAPNGSAGEREAATRLAAKRPGEDEVPIWPAPQWSKKPVAECLEEVRVYVEEQLGNELRWYAKSIRKVRRYSRGLRALALGLTGIGGLIPIVDGMNVVKTLIADPRFAALPLGQAGYLFLALAGSIALLDKFFGFSSAWMRYVTTLIVLEKQRDTFRVEWVALSRRLSAETGTESRGLPNDTDLAGRLLELAKTALAQMKAETVRETSAWVSEFQNNLAQSEKDLNAQREAARPGAIDVRILDGGLAQQGIHIYLDQMRVETVTGTFASVGNVAPGLHKITVTTRIDQRSFSASQMTEVTASSISRVEVSLGLPATAETGAAKANGAAAAPP